MVSWVVRGVVVTDVGLHIAVYVVGCHVNNDQICVGVQESDVIAIGLFEGVVVKVVHSVFGKVQDSHSNVYGLV